MPAPSTRHIEPLLTLDPPPTISVQPVISGTPVVGQTLTTDDGTWLGSPSSFARQWLRDGSEISGETGTTYVAVAGDINHVITSRITATGTTGTSQPAFSNSLTIKAELADSDVQMWTAAAAGLGGSPSAVVPSQTSVFDNVTHPEGLAGDVEYRVVYIKNTHTVRSWSAAVIWIVTQTTSPTTDVAIGVAPEPPGSDVTTIANEQTPPVGVTFSAPTDLASGVALGTLDAGEARGVWLRRTVAAATEDLPVDAVTLEWDGTPS